MSEPYASVTSLDRANPSTLLGGSALAHPVHGGRVLVQFAVVGSTFLGACVFPPDLSVGNQDAGINSPPAILSVRTDDQELTEPGPVIFDQGNGTLNVELIDTDLTDELFVRVFVDYALDHQTAPRVLCSAPTNGKAERSVTCSTNALCLPEDVADPKDNTMQIMVFDREPLEAGNPQFQQMPEGGLATSRFFFLTCAAPPTKPGARQPGGAR